MNDKIPVNVSVYLWRYVAL